MNEHVTAVHTEKATGRATYTCTCGHPAGWFDAGAHGTPATGIARAAAQLHRLSRTTPLAVKAA